MGVGVIFGFGFLLVLFVSAIILFVYTKRRRSVIGMAISVLVILGVISCLMVNYFDEWSITEKDVVSDLKFLNIQIKGKIEIISNQVKGMPERFQKTTLVLSHSDKELIIDSIRRSGNYKKFATEPDSWSDTTLYSFNENGPMKNYSYLNLFHRDIYSLIDQFPTRLMLTVDEKSDTVYYQRIER